MSPKISIKRQNTKKIRATFYQSDGTTALDITNWTVRFVIRVAGSATTADTSDSESDTDTLVVKENTTHTTPASGITDFTLDSEDTNMDVGEYDYACQASDSGTPPNVIEGATGVFEIIADVIRGT